MLIDYILNMEYNTNMQEIHKFSELEAKMIPERRAKINAEVKKALAEMPLNELRNARGLSQKMLADGDVTIANFSQIYRQ